MKSKSAPPDAVEVRVGFAEPSGGREAASVRHVRIDQQVATEHGWVHGFELVLQVVHPGGEILYSRRLRQVYGLVLHPRPFPDREGLEGESELGKEVPVAVDGGRPRPSLGHRGKW